MPNTKIDSIKLQDNITYDINLPLDATPTIASLTANTIKSTSTLYTDFIKANSDALSIQGFGSTEESHHAIIMTKNGFTNIEAPGDISLESKNGGIYIYNGPREDFDLVAKGPLKLESTESDVQVVLGANTLEFPAGKNGTIALTSDIDSKQDTLVSGTNIKRINNKSILGEGNLDTLQMSLEYEDDSEIIQGLTLLQPIESSLSTTKKDKVSIKYGSFLVNNGQAINQFVPFENDSFRYAPVVTITPVIGNATAATSATNVYCYITLVTNQGFWFTVTSGNSSLPVSKVFYTAIGQ